MRKRLLSILLALCMVLALLPGTALATEEDVAQNDFTLSGSLGGMLTAALEEESAASPSTDAVTDLTIGGTTAEVTYQMAEEDATLIVAIYDETTSQMLATGATQVSGESNTASVTISGTMPEYFVAKAFLLDSDTSAPLSEAYKTEMYTFGMQTLLSQTVDDFDSNLVLNLDDDETTNFGVYNKDTVQVEGSRAVVTDNGDWTYTVTNADEAFYSLKRGDKLSYTDAEGTLWLIKVANIAVNGSTVTITEDTSATLEDFFDTLKIEVTEQDAEVIVEGYQDPDGDAEKAVLYAAPLGDETEKSVNLKFSTPKDGDIVISGSFSVTLSVKYYYSPELGDQVVETRLTTKIEGEAKLKDDHKASVGNLKIEKMKIADILQLKFFGGVITVGLEPKVDFKAEGALDIKFTWSSTAGFRRAGDGTAENLSTSPQIDCKFNCEGTLSISVGPSLYVAIVDKKFVKLSLDGSAGVELKGTLSLLDTDEVRSGAYHECDECIKGKVTVEASISFEASAFDGKVSSKHTLLKVKNEIVQFYFSVDHLEFGWGKCPYYLYRVDLLVIDSSEEPLGGAEIMGLEDGETLTSNEDGKAWTLMHNGTYNLTASDAKHKGSKTVKVDDKAVSATIQADNLYTVVTVTVTDEDGTPLPDMTITGTGLVPAPITDNSGMAVFEVLNGSYTLKASDEKYSGEAKVTLRGLPVETTIVASKDVYEVTLTVVDEEGNALPGMTIDGTGLDPAPVTDENGVALFELRMGIYNLTASDGTYSGSETLFKTMSPQELTIVAKKQITYDVTIIVVDENGNGLPNISIDGTGLNSAPVTGADGTATFKLPAGTYNLTVTDGTLTASKALTVMDGPVELEIVLTDKSYLDWDFDEETGKLTIWGSGPMPDWNPWNWPWYGLPIQTVEIMEGITRIGNNAFYGCSSLSSIVIPAGVTSIGSGAFFDCSNLSSISLPDGVTNIGFGAFKFCSLININLPDSLTSIGDQAFYGCSSLSSINLPDSLTSIGASAFCDCSSLNSIDLPDRLTSIGNNAFYGCSNLSSIDLPDNLTTVGYFVFYNCSNLTTIRFMGDYPKSIYTNIFDGITATVYYPANNATWTADKLKNFDGNLTWIPY